MNRTAIESFGLEAWLESTRIVLPLRGMEIRAEVFSGFACVEIDQVFIQSNEQPLDCRYTFPLPADAAVHRCEMHVNGRVVLAKVEARSVAEDLYRKARQEGRRAALATGERENLFTLELGNLQPEDIILMRFSYVQSLQRLQDQRSLRVPMTPGVRFIPGAPLLRPNSGPGSADDTDRVPDASRISPPRIDSKHPDAATLTMDVKLRGGVKTTRDISSPSHILAVRSVENDLQISLATDRAFPERDFVMTWTEPAPDKIVARAWLDEGRRGVLELRLPNAPATPASACDVYFLLDRSGSMQGENWRGVCRAVASLTSRLDPATLVWLTFFESTFRDYAEKPLPAEKLAFGPLGETLEQLGTAGGTNMMEALAHVSEKVRKHSAKRPAAILLLTDGDVGNEEEVIQCARSAGCPVHIIGISLSPNDALRAISEETGGRAVFLSPGEDIPAAAERFSSVLQQPVVTGVTPPAGWKTSDGRELRDLTAGDDLIVPISAGARAPKLSLTGKSGKTKLWQVKPTLQDCKSAALIWARARIRHLERRNDSSPLNLAKQFNLLCRNAAFVAWDEAEKVVIAKKKILQPSLDVASYCIPAGCIAHRPTCFLLSPAPHDPLDDVLDENCTQESPDFARVCPSPPSVRKSIQAQSRPAAISHSSNDFKKLVALIYRAMKLIVKIISGRTVPKNLIRNLEELANILRSEDHKAVDKLLVKFIFNMKTLAKHFPECEELQELIEEATAIKDQYKSSAAKTLGKS